MLNQKRPFFHPIRRNGVAVADVKLKNARGMPELHGENRLAVLPFSAFLLRKNLSSLSVQIAGAFSIELHMCDPPFFCLPAILCLFYHILRG